MKDDVSPTLDPKIFEERSTARLGVRVDRRQIVVQGDGGEVGKKATHQSQMLLDGVSGGVHPTHSVRIQGAAAAALVPNPDGNRGVR
jgi:hypothetical protein